IRPAAAARPAPARPGEDRQPGLASPPSPARRGVAPALPRRPLVVIGPLPDPPRAPGERCFRRRVCVHPPDVHHGPGDSLYLKPLGDYSATPEEEVVPVCDAVTDNAVVGCERDEPDHYVVDPSRGMP
ncbi:MAG TPA: hypothetical protein VFQ85_14795, partial [Mycobacteriales bacterium]|nr:hypothetical protein [Mycobacteriales bacterium]